MIEAIGGWLVFCGAVFGFVFGVAVGMGMERRRR